MPHTMTDTGKVARPGSEASMVPTMPAVAAITMLLPPANACAIASTNALRLATRSSATKGAISAITDIDEFLAASMIPKPVSRLREARFGGRRKVGQDHAQTRKE